MQTLRGYQQQALDELRNGIRQGAMAQMLMAPTGSGKTTIASAIKQGACAKGKKAFFVVDSLELVDQAANRFMRDGMKVGVIQGIHPLTDYSAPIQVATIQTLRRRWPHIPAALRPDLLIIDEAHVLHSAHEEIISWCKANKVPVIGLSATPFRKGLGKIFDRLVVTVTTAELIVDGYLCRARCYAPNIPDLTGVKTNNTGDWDIESLAEVMKDAVLVGDVVEQWLKLAEGRQTIVFATNVAHSRALCDRFQKLGVNAAHVDGYDDDKENRTAIINAYRSGDIQVLCNVGVLTKGFDAPETGCIVLARPTKSLMLHIQMIGRGLRTAAGKADCIAAGSEVLTDKGLVNIESITLDHKVWDGVQFVSHGGAVCRGAQPVIEYDGLIATPDHKVMTYEGWKPIQEAADRRLPIAKTGLGGQEVRLTNDCFKKDRRCELPTEGGSYLLELRSKSHGQIPQHAEKAKHQGMSILQSEGSDNGSEMAVSTVPAAAAEVRKPESFVIREIRCAGYRVSVRESEFGCGMDCKKPWSAKRQVPANGQDRKPWALRAGKYEVGQRRGKHEQYKSVERPLEVHSVSGGLFLGSLCGLNSCASNYARAYGQRNNRSMGVTIKQAKRQVWDILSAGPLQRFTVNGRLVHNCIIIDHAGNCILNGLPDGNLPQELHDGKNSRNLDRKDREQKDPVEKPCISCGFVSTKHVCPTCGFKPEIRRDVEVVEGDLYELTPEPPKEKWTTEALASFFAELKGYAEQKGIKPGWAFFKCQEYAGRAPRNTSQIKAAAPSDQTLKIIKHLTIKAAKKRAA